MSAVVYRDTGFQGPFARVRPGFFSGRDLVGYRNQSAYGSGEDLDNAISSIRVEPNTIAALFVGQSPSASSGARVIVGPSDIPDLGALGMDNRVSAIQVVSFKSYDSGIPRRGGVTLYSDYQGGGRRAELSRGDYDALRLASEEIKFTGDRLRSLRVESNIVAILYAGPSFDIATDAAVVVGPTLIADLDRVGLGGRVSSIRVMYTDPYDIADRPRTELGSSRTYFPGGSAGWAPPASRARPRANSAPPPLRVPPVQVAPRPHGQDRRVWVAIFVLFLIMALLSTYVLSVSFTNLTDPTKTIWGGELTVSREPNSSWLA